MTKKSDFFEGSYNVFADLGLPDAEELFAKATLTCEIHRVMNARKLTQKQVAKILGTTQAKVSNLVRGRNLGQFTIDRLIKMLVALDRDVQISFKPKPKSRDHAILTVHPA